MTSQWPIIILCFSLAACSICSAIFILKKIYNQFTIASLLLTLFIGVIVLSITDKYNIDWEMTLEYFKVALSWPAIAALVSLTLIYKFQSGISGWFAKISNMKGSVFGQQFELSVQQTSQITDHNIEATVIASETEMSSASSTDLKFEELPEDIKVLEHIQDSIEWVRNNPVKITAEYLKCLEELIFERQFARFFGSQIALIAYISMSPETWHELPLLKKTFYDMYLQKGGNKDYDFKKYIEYTVNSSYIDYKNENGTECVKLTTKGRKFLSYIQQQYPNDWTSKSY